MDLNGDDSERTDPNNDIERYLRRGQILEAVEHALKYGMHSSAFFLAQYHEEKLTLSAKIRICQVLAGLGSEEDNLYPNPRSAQVLASRWFITAAAHRQWLYLYPSEIEELINQGKLDEARAKAERLPSNGYQRHILADIARRLSATKTEAS